MLSRTLEELELNRMSDHIESALRCRPDELPVEALAHAFNDRSASMAPTLNCYNSSGQVGGLDRCYRLIDNLCTTCKANRPSIIESIANGCPAIFDAVRRHDQTKGPEAPPSDVDSYAIDYIVRSVVTGEIMTRKTMNLRNILQHHRCRMDVDKQERRCRDAATDLCRRTSLVAMKVVRTSLAALERSLQRVPDLNVVFYTRDPRAVTLSRYTDDMTFYGMGHGIAEEAKVLCVQMLYDIWYLRRLERKYPTAFISLRYEDFVDDPITVAARLFGHVRRTVPPSFKDWVKSSFYAAKDGGRFDTTRANASATAHQWRKAVNRTDLVAMNRNCRTVLAELGYTI